VIGVPIGEAVQDTPPYVAVADFDLARVVVVGAGIAVPRRAARPPQDIGKIAIVLLDLDRTRFHSPDDATEDGENDRADLSGMVPGTVHDAFGVVMESLNIVS
jgi:hypothetical protein